MIPLFLQLGDHKVNVQHIRLVRELPATAPTRPCDLSIDMGPDMGPGRGCWTWYPKDTTELDWFYEVINLLRPGQLPPRIESLKAKLCAGAPPVQASAGGKRKT